MTLVHDEAKELVFSTSLQAAAFQPEYPAESYGLGSNSFRQANLINPGSVLEESEQ